MLKKIEYTKNNLLNKKIENIFMCPICYNDIKIHNNSLICKNGHCYDISKKGYFTLLKKNKLAFELSEKEETDNEVLSVNKKGSSNAKNIIKILKECLKLEEKFTDIEIEKINKIINLLENGELPVRIVKEANKEIKKITGVNDIAKFYKKLEILIPKTYIELETKVETNNKKISKKEKEIILSEYVF